MAGVSKRYNGHDAVADLDLEIPAGAVVGVIGPSGSGKTTTIRMITGSLAPTSGTVEVLGERPGRLSRRTRERMGYLPQQFSMYPDLSVIENVDFAASLYGLVLWRRYRRRRAVLKLVDLWSVRGRRAGELSGGMRRRLELAAALVHEPRLLILDEPTAGVDIEIRRSMWEFLRDINARGTTIILTTHYLEEAETLCRNIAIINGGLIAERDRMSSLLRKLQAETFLLSLREAITSVPQVPGYVFELVDDHTLEVEVSKEQSLNEVFAKLTEQGIGVLSMRNKVNRLEEIFMNLVEARGEQRPAAVARS